MKICEICSRVSETHIRFGRRKSSGRAVYLCQDCFDDVSTTDVVKQKIMEYLGKKN